MYFRFWLESEKAPPSIIDTSELTSQHQYLLGNAAFLEDGNLIGYHVTDNPNSILSLKDSKKQITSTYKYGKHSELGPGLYVSASPQLWLNRSRNKWGFLKDLTPENRQKLADKLRNDKTLIGSNIQGKVFHHVASFEREYAFRDIDSFAKGNNEAILNLAGQPYNIAFWKPEYLKPIGIESGTQPKIIKVTFSGHFVNLKNHVHDWSTISNYIRKKMDGGFNPGGMIGYPELCIWRKECIINMETTNEQF